METGNPHLHEPPQKIEYGTGQAYLTGLLLSIFLTFAIYFTAVGSLFSGLLHDVVLGLLGIVQAVVQLVFFLHVMKEPKPRWNMLMFYFMLMVLVIIVFGSIWIMNNLNYNLMDM